ncbi:MAG: aminomethyl-transferring glycine dehydrogenase [Planctomycetota bacterium]
MPASTSSRPAMDFAHPDRFVARHVGPRPAAQLEMLTSLGYDSLDALSRAAVPAEIALDRDLQLPAPLSEADCLERLADLAAKNEVRRSYIGMGYADCITPPPIQRNILENPGWYTQYTPYQAEISQGRLEMLLSFQTMIADLTGLPIANASLLDEGTAVAEAVSMAVGVNRKAKSARFLVHDRVHPQSLAVLHTRADALGIEIVVGDPFAEDLGGPWCGVVVQTPDTDGRLHDITELVTRAHAADALVIVATDLLALTLVTPPGELGADIAVGSAQRFGVPLGFGGPHAAFLATREEHKRQMPGRIIGQTRSADGGTALRLALQTREQHIRREKATSNICTAQVLLAIMATAYGIYHGPEGLTAIARRVRGLTLALREGLARLGYEPGDHPVFDTLSVPVDAKTRAAILDAADKQRMNLRVDDASQLGISLDETTSAGDVADLLAVFAAGRGAKAPAFEDVAEAAAGELPRVLSRHSEFLTHPVFHGYRSETELLRYLTRLQSRDLSLTTSMIPLGSCTMKLNAASEMLPVTYPGFGKLHPFAPASQTAGYRELFDELEAWLAEITGFAAVSLQPNAGSQGEYAGMLVIRAWHASRGETHRDVCLIPASAHGTNPASAVMAGMKVVVVKNLADGRIDVEDLKAKAAQHADRLAAIMVTYPSTYGVFESTITDVTRIVHEHGGQVYLDGANLNAQMGLARPGDYGADVCHLNLHKTFCIPHGGGGPGMGPIGVAQHLAPFLPGHPVVATGGSEAIGPVSAAPWGSSSILPISYAYIRMMGAEGLKLSSQVAILNANYMAKRLENDFPVLFRGAHGLCAHEFILDVRHLEEEAGVTVEDVAKRLMDYGFHAPTVSWPVPGTIMIEPTESESRAECDRLCDALLAIRQESRRVASGEWPKDDNPLHNAPHTAREVTADTWSHPYTRETAAFPAPWLQEHKFWPSVKRADSVYGDRHLIVCACIPTEAYAEA